MNHRSFLKRTLNIIVVITLCFLTLFHFQPVQAATFRYVATNGSNSNPGTISAPYATLAYAISQSGPGDVIYMRGGVYNFTNNIYWTSPSGTANAWISVQAYPNEVPIIDCSQTSTVSSCLSVATQYIEIKGLEIRNSRKSGLVVWNGNHVRLQNNTVHHSENQGIYVNSDSGVSITDVLVDRNIVYQNAQMNAPIDPLVTGGWPPGIGISSSTSVATVTNNLVYENYGEGIIASSSSTLVRGNTLHDNFSVNLYLNRGSNNIFEQNFIYTLGNTAFFRANAPAYGIAVANESGSPTTSLTNNIIRNNIVVGGRAAFKYGNFLNAGGMHSTQIVHNVFYTGQEYAVKIDQDAHANTRFYNNAIVQTGTAPILSFSGSGITFDHNGWYGGSPGVGAGTGDILSNPKFANAGGLSATDYKLQATSPLISQAATSSTSNDFWGNTRPQGSAPDIGAHEVSPKNILFVVGALPLSSDDQLVSNRLAGLNFQVTVKDQASVATSDATGKNLVVISSSVGSTVIGTLFRDVTVPVMTWENALYDDMKMTGTNGPGTDYGTNSGQTSVTIINSTHPMAAGLSGTITVLNTAQTIPYGMPNTNAVKIATIAGNSARITIFGYDTGVTMVGMNAPARRVGFFFENSAPSNATTNGWLLFDAAVNWASN